eukprot:GHRR01015470.1.p2 GENE.GHRR01015470.1~~GHRR01015470.1.p2  ORF type:complete len:119 (+),score=13.86 GHRR01015470.1:353-709(+)
MHLSTTATETIPARRHPAPVNTVFGNVVGLMQTKASMYCNSLPTGSMQQQSSCCHAWAYYPTQLRTYTRDAAGALVRTIKEQHTHNHVTVCTVHHVHICTPHSMQQCLLLHSAFQVSP